jgi:tRNA(fMet)-specific endonuclease VapC
LPALGRICRKTPSVNFRPRLLNAAARHSQGDAAVKQALIDTDILSMFFRENLNVVDRFKEYLQEYGRVSLSIVTYYEIVSGLKHRDARKQLAAFLDFVGHNVVLSLTEHSTEISAEGYASLRKKGQSLDDIDLLIAGVALANGLVLVTHNTDHFGKIEGLELEDWSLARNGEQPYKITPL